MSGYLVTPADASGPLPSVIVIHENRGLNPHIKDVTRRMALEGFRRARRRIFWRRPAARRRTRRRRAR